jgi:hypothetical protein
LVDEKIFRAKDHFFRTNAYFVTWKGDIYDYIASGELWPHVVQLELDTNMLRSTYHSAILFNVDDDTF